MIKLFQRMQRMSEGQQFNLELQNPPATSGSIQ